MEITEQKYEQICCNQEQLEEFPHREWVKWINNWHTMSDVLWAWCKIMKKRHKGRRIMTLYKFINGPFESCMTLFMRAITAWLKSTALFANAEIWLRSTKQAGSWSTEEEPNQINSPRAQVIKFGLKRKQVVSKNGLNLTLHFRHSLWFLRDSIIFRSLTHCRLLHPLGNNFRNTKRVGVGLPTDVIRRTLSIQALGRGTLRPDMTVITDWGMSSEPTCSGRGWHDRC